MINASKIRSFWKQKATEFQSAPEASWGDMLMEKEISVITNFISDGDRVLDMGCANGYSSIRFAVSKKIKLLGIDYVPEMVKFANKAKNKLPNNIAERLTFKVGDVLSLKVPHNSFDVVNSTRCVCNLTSWLNQKKAIENMWKALKPGGTLLLSEPTIQGLEQLNKMGKKFNLKPVPMPWHNLYIDEDNLLKYFDKKFQIHKHYLSSTYYFMSRIIYRWLMNDDARKLSRNSLLNRIGVKLPSIGTFGTQRLFVMKKLTHNPGAVRI